MYILCVEDNPVEAGWITRVLRNQGHEAVLCRDAFQGLALAQEREPDVIVTDYRLPGMSGVSLIQRLRCLYPRCAIILTSAFLHPQEVSDGFRSGADDVLIKPLQEDMLLARLWDANLHRQVQAPLVEPLDGPLEVDRQKRQVRWFGQLVDVTPGEYDLLAYLTLRAGQVVSVVDLYQAVNGCWAKPDQARGCVKTHVVRLRRKLTDPQGRAYLITVRGQGYRWSAGGEGPEVPARQEQAQ